MWFFDQVGRVEKDGRKIEGKEKGREGAGGERKQRAKQLGKRRTKYAEREKSERAMGEMWCDRGKE